MSVYFEKGATPDELAIGDLLMDGKVGAVFVRVHTLDGKQGEMSIGFLAGVIREELIRLQEREKLEKQNAQTGGRFSPA
jgi:hypothetical protein